MTRGEAVYGPYHTWVKGLACHVAISCEGPVDGHHLKSVGAGGQDHGNEVPLCRLHHRQIHQMGLSRFEALHGVRLKLRAARLAKEWESLQGDLAY